MVMLQQCVGERFLDVRSVQDGMTKEGVLSVEKAVCVLTLRGTHGAGDQRCPVRERQVEVARIRMVQKVEYAEAWKSVVEEDWSRAGS